MEAHLDSLPAEVQIAILRQLDSISSLTSLLKASPRILEVYHTNRDAIFPDIVYNQTTPLAIRAWHLRRLDEVSDVDTFATILDCTPDPLELCIFDWKQLYRYHCIVDKMLQGSVKRALDVIHPYFSSPLSDSVSGALSTTEYHRLVRGFYNWELLTSICGRYFHMKLSDIANSTISPSLSTLRYLQCFSSFRDSLALHEVEEMLFTAHYLRERLYDYVTRAEDYRFTAWKNAGPYKYRYNFEDSDDWIWSNNYRDAQDLWVSRTLYGENLVGIYQIIEGAQPDARPDRFDRLELVEYLTQGPLKIFQELTVMLKDRRKATMFTLSSHLASGWSSGKIDWTQLQFIDDSNRPNVGLLWSYKMSMEPFAEILDQLGVGGIAVWDYARFQSMGILQKYPEDVLDADELTLMGEGERETRSVESRALDVERDWIAKGLMKPGWRPHWSSGQSDDEYDSEFLNAEQHGLEAVVLESSAE